MPLNHRIDHVLCIALLSFVVSGCGQSEVPSGRLLQVDLPIRHLPSLTMSEVRESGHGEIEGDFELKNLTAGTLVVSVLSTSCTCVGVQADGRSLSGQDEFEIPASQSRTVQVTRPINSGGGLVSADVTLRVKGQKTSQQETVSLSVDRDILPDIRSIPLIMRETFTNSSPHELVRTVDLTVASRDPDWLQQTSVTSEELPDGMSLGEVTDMFTCRKISDGMYLRSWRIKVVLTRDSFDSDGNNVSTLLRLMVRANDHPDRVVSWDIPVSIIFKNSSKSLAGPVTVGTSKGQ